MNPYFSIHSHIIIGNKYPHKCWVHRYSKSPLIWHNWDREVLDYQYLCILHFLQFFYSFYNWAVQLFRGELCLVTFFISWSRIIRVLFCFFWSLHRCPNFGVGDKGSGDTTTVEIQLLVVFLNLSLRSACFTDKAFSGKNQNFLSQDCSQVLD